MNNADDAREPTDDDSFESIDLAALASQPVVDPDSHILTGEENLDAQEMPALSGDEANAQKVEIRAVAPLQTELVNDDDEEAERIARAIGIGSDGRLHNSSSTEKEALLEHLKMRFEMIARQKLETLSPEQAKLVEGVALCVDIRLTFGGFHASGGDESLFSVREV